MEPAEPRPRSYTLQRAAVVVFAFVTVLPMLLYVDTLYLLGALGRTMVLVNLALAAGAILIGFYLYWSMTSRMAEILRAAQERQEAAPHGHTEPAADFQMPAFGAIREVEPIRETDMMPGAGGHLRPVSDGAARPHMARRGG